MPLSRVLRHAERSSAGAAGAGPRGAAAASHGTTAVAGCLQYDEEKIDQVKENAHLTFAGPVKEHPLTLNQFVPTTKSCGGRRHFEQSTAAATAAATAGRRHFEPAPLQPQRQPMQQDAAAGKHTSRAMVTNVGAALLSPELKDDHMPRDRVRLELPPPRQAMAAVDMADDKERRRALRERKQAAAQRKPPPFAVDEVDSESAGQVRYRSGGAQHF